MPEKHYPDWFDTLYQGAVDLAHQGHFQFLESTLGAGRLLKENPQQARRIARQASDAIMVHRSLSHLPIGESLIGGQVLQMLDSEEYPRDLRERIRNDLGLPE